MALPRPTLRWQYAAAAVLFGLTLLSAVQLGLLANISKLPKVSDIDTNDISAAVDPLVFVVVQLLQ